MSGLRQDPTFLKCGYVPKADIRVRLSKVEIFFGFSVRSLGAP
jgi:hypothetical protein